jgi:hypothetical protein
MRIIVLSELVCLLCSVCVSCGQAPVTHSPTATLLPAGPLPIIGKDCGTVGGLRKAGNPAASEQCLYLAYQQCQSATLVDIQAGVDTGKYHYLTVQTATSPCSVQDRVITYGTTPHQMANYDCQGLVFTPGDGLTAQQCGGEGDVHIPASFSSP